MKKEYTLVYKWHNASAMQTPTGKGAETDTHTATVEAGNYKSAVKKLRDQVANATLNRQIKIISQIELE
jgi:hypothetical protein